MTAFGRKAFTDADSYRTGLTEVEVRLVVTGAVEFAAQVSWLDMDSLRLCTIEEKAPRVAFISLPPSPQFVSFPLADSPPVIWNGIPLNRGDLVLHASGDRFHQRTTGATRWGLVSMPAKDLAHYGQTLLDCELSAATTRLLLPSARSSAELLRLHAQASRLARAKPDLLDRREVVRALEQELIHALVTALGTADRASDAWRRPANVMARFEEVLATHDDAKPLPALCAEIGIAQRSLRVYCAALLGCSPLAYARLRRLNLARSTLLKADHATTGVAEVARSHGFSEPGRFAVAYRRLFGEAPLATLLRAPCDSAESA